MLCYALHKWLELNKIILVCFKLKIVFAFFILNCPKIDPHVSVQMPVQKPFQEIKYEFHLTLAV